MRRTVQPMLGGPSAEWTSTASFVDGTIYDNVSTQSQGGLALLNELTSLSLQNTDVFGNAPHDVYFFVNGTTFNTLGGVQTLTCTGASATCQ